MLCTIESIIYNCGRRFETKVCESQGKKMESASYLSLLTGSMKMSICHFLKKQNFAWGKKKDPKDWFTFEFEAICIAVDDDSSTFLFGYVGIVELA